MSHPNSFLILQDNPYTEMVFVKAGKSFMLGEPKEKVKEDNEEGVEISLKRDFYIGKYPVTQGFWKKIMDGNNPSDFIEDKRPVEQVSWWDICGNPDYETATEEGGKTSIEESFLYKLKNQKDIVAVLKDGKFDLPSEAQWEYAARGGAKAIERFEYAGSNNSGEVAWHWKNSLRETKPVGQKAANELGLYDMSGNVREWCRDYSHKKHEEKRAFVDSDHCFLKEKSDFRVLRGGSWDYLPSYARAAYRTGHRPYDRLFSIGFRLVFFF